MKNLCSGTQCGGFQFVMILYLWGVSFHTVVVFALGKNLLFKFALGRSILLCYKNFQVLWWLAEGMLVLPQLKMDYIFNKVKKRVHIRNVIVFINFFLNFTLIWSLFFGPALGYPKFGRFLTKSIHSKRKGCTLWIDIVWH